MNRHRAQSVPISAAVAYLGLVDGGDDAGNFIDLLAGHNSELVRA